MSKYVCARCGAEFDEPDKRPENIGEAWGVSQYVMWDACPMCGDVEIDEVNEDEMEECDE